MLSKVEGIFMFAIVAGLAVMIWAKIYGKARTGKLTSGCGCGGKRSATSSGGNGGNMPVQSNSFDALNSY